MHSDRWLGTDTLDVSPDWHKITEKRFDVNVHKLEIEYCHKIFAYLDAYNKKNPLTVSFDDFVSWLHDLNSSYSKQIDELNKRQVTEDENKETQIRKVTEDENKETQILFNSLNEQSINELSETESETESKTNKVLRESFGYIIKEMLKGNIEHSEVVSIIENLLNKRDAEKRVLEDSAKNVENVTSDIKANVIGNIATSEEAISQQYANDNNSESLEYRMYGFVPYQLSGIQSGIQFGHGVVEYSLTYSESFRYKKWAQLDKTFIVLNGGTTNDNPLRLGTLNKLMIELDSLGIKYSIFREPDLGDQITSINFLVDERVWNKEKYPFDENESAEVKTEMLVEISRNLAEAERILETRYFLSKFKLA